MILNLLKVINSGCANAVTGEEGLKNARTMSSIAGKALGLKHDALVMVYHFTSNCSLLTTITISLPVLLGYSLICPKLRRVSLSHQRTSKNLKTPGNW